MAIPAFRQLPPGGWFNESQQAANALTKQALEQKRQQIENKYLPYTSYAQAQSQLSYANYLPWQIKSQILSNPYLSLALKDHPEMLNKMLEEFGKGMHSGNQLSNGMNMPLPSQIGNESNGLVGLLAQKLLGGNASQGNNAITQMPGQNGTGTPDNAMQSMPSSSPNAGTVPPSGTNKFPLVPSTQGTASGLIGQQTAPMTKSPYISNPTIPNPNNPNEVISAPGASTVETTQKAVLAAKRVTPILNNIFRDFQDVYNIPGMLKLGISMAGNFSGLSKEKLDELGIPKGEYAKFLKAQNNVDKAIIDVMKVYDIHQESGMNDRISNIIKFHPGEDKEGYFDRVQSELNDIKTQQDINEQAMTSGYTVSALGNQPEAQKGLVLPSFNSKEEFQQWFSAQPLVTQQAVMLHLKGKK